MSDADDDLLSYEQVSRMYAIKTGTLQSMVCRKQIPHVRIGPRTVRFRASDLKAWLAERNVAPEADRSR